MEGLRHPRCKRNIKIKNMAFNPIIAEKMLEELMASPNGIAKMCAKKLGVDLETFIAQLNGMGVCEYISPVPPLKTVNLAPFSHLVIDGIETLIDVMILDAGRKYLDELQKTQTNPKT